jgi:hypothetical protein
VVVHHHRAIGGSKSRDQMGRLEKRFIERRELIVRSRLEFPPADRFAVTSVGAETESMSNVSKNLPAPLRVNASVDDILTHPAFAGFGRLLLPWDDCRYDTTMLLRNIGALLPYHTQQQGTAKPSGAHGSGAG